MLFEQFRIGKKPRATSDDLTFRLNGVNDVLEPVFYSLFRGFHHTGKNHKLWLFSAQGHMKHVEGDVWPQVGPLPS